MTIIEITAEGMKEREIRPIVQCGWTEETRARFSEANLWLSGMEQPVKQ